MYTGVDGKTLFLRGEGRSLFTVCMHACVLGIAESPYHCVEQTNSDLYCGLLLWLSCHHQHHHYHINKKYTKIKEKERETISTPENKWLGFQNVYITHTTPAHPQHQISDLHAPPPTPTPHPLPMFCFAFQSLGHQGNNVNNKELMIQEKCS